MSTFLALLAKLVIVHCLCDYPLQGDFLARAKRRGGVVGVPWYHALTAHAAIHAGGVWLLLGNPWLALAEFGAHWAIDYWKCAAGTFGTAEQEVTYDIDQAFHIVCKVMWILVYFAQL